LPCIWLEEENVLRQQLGISIRAILVLSAVTGIGYPLTVTGLAQALFPHTANGSLVVKDGKPIGSGLIGQPFDAPGYFWSRLSATSPVPYNAAASSGSNLGPMNPALVKAVQDRVNALRRIDAGNTQPIPVDLVTSSASGLDPHITPAAARYQLERVARARGLSQATIDSLIRKNTEGRFLGILGEPGVNVLRLNLALDQAKRSKPE
jgi:potassium-transporting ATPase KdpC subunit